MSMSHFWYLAAEIQEASSEAPKIMKEWPKLCRTFQDRKRTDCDQETPHSYIYLLVLHVPTLVN